MGNLKERVATLLGRLETSRIILVEWETSIQIRLGYPLVSNGSLFFLVPDDQLQRACDLAAELGLYPADENTLRPAYTSEFSNLADRYLIDDSARYPPNEGPPQRRLVLLPMSWAGITRDELVPISDEDNSHPILPCTVWTVPLPAACTAFVYIAARERRGSLLRSSLIEGLSSVISYNLFDVSYEGDYMEFPLNDEPLLYKKISEIENTMAEINCWVFMNGKE
ncbi:hypothetical protein K432DRAFT_297905 [Lepidopterella palustris CBS 459.81]|uniref:Uncharacterized protein n=1 Tax=Lepidopterella palustris CBS 459.81 TaxID=1314670 RepID=A0A8E2EAR8_9PEZI|nr:hypothetical protein K432DRAFT_297905 [Lepidopterella palustris CBS 459.81]